jgi:phospholipase C
VTALLDGELFQVFVSDPAGGIYTARGSSQAGWGPWQSVSEGGTAPGTPVTALLDGDHFQVFVSDPAGGIYTARGSAQAGWGPWQNVSEGSTAPGTPVTALLDGDRFQVFVSDPAGGIYTARGSAQAGWGPWQNVSEGLTAPGTPVTALLDGDRFQVFVSDPAGGVYTARGGPQAGWGPWRSLSEKDETLGVVPDDVLGYYDGSQLPMFEYLAEYYAYCDRYFCSHPGPTMPNRMYSLTGDVQYDRLGVPILDNNHGDNFLLSRALTIYDVLTKLGVRWRVYESNPSVTMLRMFARYATNDTEIVSIDSLEADAAAGNLPELTVIEPRMHSQPQDDDHPDADMWRGQQFIKRVYQALRNAPTWEKTVLIITYDEHGGLYDHVVPPVADLLRVSGSSDEAQPSLTIPYGVRVPTFVVSPWTKRGKGEGITLDHCSILKTVLARFAGEDKPFMSDRVHVSQSFDAYLSEPAPPTVDEPLPVLEDLPIDVRRVVPGASAIETAPLSRKRMRQGPVDYHELSGRLARMLGR